jgi:hypothetical protein
MSVHEMGHLLYEIRVPRRPEADRVLDVCAWWAMRAEAPEQTLISLRNADDDQVHHLVDWLTDLRLEVASIRRRNGNADHRHRAGDPPIAGQHADVTHEDLTYEVGVFGRLGPALLSTLPHDAVRLVPAHTVLLLRGWDGVLRLLEALVAADVAVQSVRRLVLGRPGG